MKYKHVAIYLKPPEYQRLLEAACERAIAISKPISLAQFAKQSLLTALEQTTESERQT